MSDTEFASALKARAWRTAAGAGTDADPAAPASPTRTKPALDMSETEFNTALKRRAWR